mgnify:CR=1 FL=1
MNAADIDSNGPVVDRYVRLIHAGLIISAIAALISSEWSGDYKNTLHLGFTVHMWCGIATAFFLSLRILYGLLGPASVRFMEWVPYTRERWAWVIEDLRGLLRARLPDRPTHAGLAGAVQAAGLVIFLFMAFTGTLMALYLEPGQKATGLISLAKEVHEAFSNLVYVYLVLHVGAVVAHSALGHPVWQRMFVRRPN